MTHDEIMALSPEDLCREVAEKVMGWHLGRLGTSPTLWLEDDGENWRHTAPWRPDRDPRCWWQVWEKLSEMGFSPTMFDRTSMLPTAYRIALHANHEVIPPSCVLGDTPGIAVCRASLMAIQHKEN